MRILETHWEEGGFLKIRIITDSGCDITQAEAKSKGITILPLKTRFNETEYLDGITISTQEFYEHLVEYDEFPTTSQVAPFEYEKAFEEALKEYDHVLCITISSKLSGCYQSASIAASEFEGAVTVIDSLSVSLGARIFVEYAVNLLTKENDLEKIVDDLTTQREKLVVLALMDTLEYLKKGGRISAAAALAGNVLSIKPVITLKEGEIIVVGKARGSKNGNNLLSQCVLDRGEMDFSKPLCLAYSGLSDALIKKYVEDCGPIYCDDPKSIPIYIIGSTVGTHAGPGAIAIAYFSK